MVTRFDIVPTDDGGEWRMPARDSHRMVGSIHPPSQDTTVRITTREAYKGDRWSLIYGKEEIVEKASTC